MIAHTTAHAKKNLNALNCTEKRFPQPVKVKGFRKHSPPAFEKEARDVCDLCDARHSIQPSARRAYCDHRGMNLRPGRQSSGRTPGICILAVIFSGPLRPAVVSAEAKCGLPAVSTT